MATSGEFNHLSEYMTQVMRDVRRDIAQSVEEFEGTDAANNRLHDTAAALEATLQSFVTNTLNSIRQVVEDGRNVNVSAIINALELFKNYVKPEASKYPFYFMNQVVQALLDLYSRIDASFPEHYLPYVAKWSRETEGSLTATRAIIAQNEQLMHFDMVLPAMERAQAQTVDLDQSLSQLHRLAAEMNVLRDETIVAKNEIESSWERQKSDTTSHLQFARELASQAEESLADVKALTEGQASAELQASFTAYGEVNDKRARTNQTWANFFYVTTIAFAVFTSFWIYADHQPAGWADVVWRIAIISGGLGFATYLTKQASHHRAQYNWAHAINVQLRTFRAFTDLIPDSQAKDDLRTYFAKRVFGPEPGSSAPPQDEAATGVSLDDLSKITTIIRNIDSTTPGTK